MSELDNFLLDSERGRRELLSHAKRSGNGRAERDYPDYIYRNRQQIEKLAIQRFQETFTWMRADVEKNLREFQKRSDKEWREYHSSLTRRGYGYGRTWQQVKTEEINAMQGPLNSWDSHLTEARQQYITFYVNAYLERVNELEEKEAVNRQPPPQLKPMQPPPPQQIQQTVVPTNTATLDGAKVTLKRVERDANEYVYHLELIDPAYIDGVEETEWVVYFEGATVPENTHATNSSSPEIASSGNIRAALGKPLDTSTSRTTQRPRKPLGSYLRKH